MRITRQELFEKVWSEPVTKVSKSLGLSDRGLGKLCARYDVPVPPRGYWARRGAGYKDAQPALPVAKRPADELVWVQPPQTAQRVATAPSKAKLEHKQEDLIVVTAGRPRHHLARLTAAALRGGTTDQYHRLWGGRGVLDVRVAKASITRAIGILDALLSALEGRGHQVSIKDNKSVVIVDGEPIEFGLDERSVQKERPLPLETWSMDLRGARLSLRQRFRT